MNSFIPENPTVVLQMSKDGIWLTDTITAVIRSANNIAYDINIVLVPDKETFDKEAANQPFNTERPLTQGVLSSAASKARYAARA